MSECTAQPSTLNWSSHVAQFTLMGAVFFTPLSPFLAHIFISALLVVVWIKDVAWREIFSMPVVITAVGLFFLFGLSMLYTQGPQAAALHNLHKYWKLLFVPIVIAVAVGVDRERVLMSYVAAMIVTAICGVIKFAGYLSVKEAGGLDVVFHNHIYTGFMMSVAAYYLYLSWYHQPKGRTTKLLLLALLLGQLLFINEGRTGYLIVAGLMALAGYQRFSWRGLSVAVLVVVGLFTTAYHVNPRIGERIAKVTQEAQLFSEDPSQYTSIGTRLLFATHSIALVTHHPLLGYGVGSFPDAYYQQFPLDKSATDGLGEPHNEFINMAFQLGLLGLAGFMFYLSALWVVSWSCSPLQRQFLQGLIVAFMLGACCDDFLMLSPTGYSFILLSSVLAAGTVRQR